MIVTRSKSDFLAFANNEAAELPQYTIEPGVPVMIPFCESADSQPYLSAGMSFEALHSSDPSKRHTVTILHSKINGEAEFHVVCGDTYLSGRSKGGKRAAEERVRKALAQAGRVSAADLGKALTDCFGMFSPDSACSFWRDLRKNSSCPGCKHVKAIFYQLLHGGSTPKLPAVLDAMGTAYESAVRPTSSPASPAFPPLDELNRPLRRFAGRGVREKYPVKIEGDRGMGKTYAARELGKTYEHYEELQGMEGLEGVDFLGSNVPYDGKMVWQDGPVSSAFRKAQAGKATLLFADEFYRIPRRERSLFLTALIPHDGKYRLRTGRIINVADGVAEMEMLYAPVANLAVVAATNSGSHYDVDADDPALMERWITILHNPSEAYVRAVLEKSVASRGFCANTADKLAKFRGNCTKLLKDRKCTGAPSLRLLDRALNVAGAIEDLPAAIREVVWPNLTGRTPEGALIAEQVAGLEKALTLAFP